MKKNDFVVYHPDGRVPDLQIIGIAQLNEMGFADDMTVTLRGTEPQLMAMFSTIAHQLSQKFGHKKVTRAFMLMLAMDKALDKVFDFDESEDDNGEED